MMASTEDGEHWAWRALGICVPLRAAASEAGQRLRACAASVLCYSSAVALHLLCAGMELRARAGGQRELELAAGTRPRADRTRSHRVGQNPTRRAPLAVAHAFAFWR